MVFIESGILVIKVNFTFGVIEIVTLGPACNEFGCNKRRFERAAFFVSKSLTAMLRISVTTSSGLEQIVLWHIFTHCKWEKVCIGLREND